MSRLSILVTICAALCFTSVESDYASVVDVSSLLQYPPYYSALGYSRPASLSDFDYQKLLQISQQYNVKLSDLYQLYDLSRSNLSTYGGSDEYINMIQQFAQAMETERMRRGLSRDYYSDMDYLYDQGKTKASYLYNQGRNAASDLYDQGKNTASNLYDMSKYAASSVYNNIYNMYDHTISKPTQAFKNQINYIIYGSGIQADMDSAENFANKITESMRSMIYYSY